MTLLERLDKELVRALKAHEKDQADAIRMIKTRISEKRTSAGFTGEIDDELVIGLIGSYVKTLEKSIKEIEGGGRGDSPVVAKYRFEVDYLGAWLPKMKSEEETRELVRALVSDLAVSGKGAIGRVMGAVMKAHKGEVDAALVRRIAETELGE
ncbi:MAG: GatB/YqeY domain-containing protein [Deltaproteobacteria bacterium]|nr:GatB/YqeY domain-containing protein [Deltaproteobacteria bacterium]